MPINQYSTPVQNSLEQYIPLPLEQVYKAASAIQQRGDIQQNQNDTVQTGLSSMEALAPAHKDFVNQFSNDYKSQQGALLDKYHGNTSDPQYEQEARRLNMQFASDPRLQVIKQANDNYRKKQALSQELQAKGIKFLDSNPQFTGRDSNGNLVSDAGTLKGTMFDSNINQSFKDKEQAIEQVGHTLTNRRNLAKVHNSYIDPKTGQLNTDNQDVQDGLNYYRQQGLSDVAAAQALKNHIDAGMGYAHDLKDHFYEISPYQQAELDLEKAKLDKTKQQPPVGPPPFQLLDYSKPIAPTGKESQDIKQETPNSQVFNQVQKTIKGLDKSGNLNAGERRVEDTPENRTKFGKNATPVQDIVAGGGMGYGSSSYSSLSVKDKYDPDEVNLLNTARKVLGVTGGTAKDVLNKYSDLIKSFDTGAFKVTSTDNKKLNDVMADVARRQIATGEVYKLDRGELKKVNDPKELDQLQTSASSDNTKDNEIKNMQIAGISPKSLGPLNGYTQFSNKGTNYYTAIPDQMQRKFNGSKSVENYIQDFDPKKLHEIPIQTRQGNVKAFRDPNQEPIDYVYQGIRGRLIPYKSNQGGKLGGGGLFQFVDPKTGETQLAPIPLSELEREEKTSLFTEIVNNNKIKGD